MDGCILIESQIKYEQTFRFIYLKLKKQNDSISNDYCEAILL
jgi:hypothetical protein